MPIYSISIFFRQADKVTVQSLAAGPPLTLHYRPMSYRGVRNCLALAFCGDQRLLSLLGLEGTTNRQATHSVTCVDA